MKRIIAIFSNKLDEVKKERKMRRLSRAIDSAIDNAQDSLDAAKIALEEAAESLPETTDFSGYVQNISDKMDEMEVHKKTLARLQEIKAYLEEDISVK